MSGESPRSLSNLIQTAFSFPSDTDSEIEFIDMEGTVIPDLRERPSSPFEAIDENTS
jgi:hypothetical protein